MSGCLSPDVQNGSMDVGMVWWCGMVVWCWFASRVRRLFLHSCCSFCRFYFYFYVYFVFVSFIVFLFVFKFLYFYFYYFSIFSGSGRSFKVKFVRKTMPKIRIPTASGFYATTERIWKLGAVDFV